MASGSLGVGRVRGLLPLGRMQAIQHENRRLRETLALIAAQGDARNAEITRINKKDGEPESWAARIAYFTLHPERRGG